ncbi:cytochrome c1 [Solimicrobium silvestre]|uniref:Cytochrome c1 n=1 Tax=Solimicrobium silvestre TaxID=2099400 RepID=A0A2S9H1Y8_9BURK|nr:cytochrome c1 [Solimicrobium silvestre]PRC93989.1 Cytochrome c1 [Solimicrobium silvestre]
MKFVKTFIATLVLLPALALASEGYPLDKAPDRANNMAALQNGAKLFVNYCLNCHSAVSMRYSRLKDLGLTDDQIKNNLLLAGDKVGDLMTTHLSVKDAKAWFGAAPPDLSVIARSKSSEAGSGPDWLYTYLRTYYKDESRPTGWNNMVFPNVGMPHVLWELQGVRSAEFEEVEDEHDHAKKTIEFKKFTMLTPGKLTPLEYDNEVADLVGYLNWMGEPAQSTRKRLGVWVLMWLSLLSLLAWRLNASYWKEVK